MTNAHIEIGKIIREYRQKREMTQAELSKMLGHETPQFLSFIERGLSKTPLNTLGQLIIYLDIPERKVMNILLSAHKENLITEINTGKKSAKKLS